MLVLGAFIGDAAPFAVGPPVRPPLGKREAEPANGPPVRPPLGKREAEPAVGPPVRPPLGKREAEPAALILFHNLNY